MIENSYPEVVGQWPGKQVWKPQHAEIAPVPSGPEAHSNQTIQLEASSERPEGSGGAVVASSPPGRSLGDLRKDSEPDICEVADTDSKLQRLAQESAFLDVEHPITLYEAAKMVVMLPVVLSKFIVLSPLVVFFYIMLRLMLLGHPRQQPAPMHPVRRRLVEFWVCSGARILLFFAGYYWIPLKGWQNMERARDARSILVFNHESYVDACAMAAFFAPSGVAKSGVATMPVIGLFAIALQFFFIERKGMLDKANRYVLRRDPITSIRERAADRRYPLVMMAPEATTKAKRCLLKFRRGAFAAGCPITPVLIRFHYQHFNPGWGICFTPLHFYRMLAQFVNYMEFEVLPPVYPSPLERKDPMLFADNVRRLMAQHLEVPVVDQGVAHMRELMARGVHPSWRGDHLVVPPQEKKKKLQ